MGTTDRVIEDGKVAIILNATEYDGSYEPWYFGIEDFTAETVQERLYNPKIVRKIEQDIYENSSASRNFTRQELEEMGVSGLIPYSITLRILYVPVGTKFRVSTNYMNREWLLTVDDLIYTA